MNEDQAGRVLELVGEALATLRKVDAKVSVLDVRLHKLEQTVDLFRAETQEEFAGVKLRLLRIEQKLDDHEARISALEQR
jgi:hypothetical protein